MTVSMLSRAGRVGLVSFAVVAFATFTLSWFSADGKVIIGLDLVYVKSELPDLPHPLIQYFLEIAPLPAYLGLLLAGTVAVRRRWARIVAVVVVVLAAALAAASAAGLLGGIKEYWQPDDVLRYRLFALITAMLAALLLAAAVALAVGLRRAYQGFVVVLLLASAAFQLTGTAMLAGQGVGSTMTVVPWLTGVAYLLAAGCAVLAATGPAGAGPPPAAPAPDPAGTSAVRG